MRDRPSPLSHRRRQRAIHAVRWPWPWLWELRRSPSRAGCAPTFWDERVRPKGETEMPRRHMATGTPWRTISRYLHGAFPMQQRTLGKHGPHVSALGLGCMGMSGMYGPADRAESIATIHAALDAGITLLDTGDFYGMGHNEMLIGEALTDAPRDSCHAQRQVRRAARRRTAPGSATTRGPRR